MSTPGQLITEQMLHASPWVTAASKLHKLVGLSAAMAGDAAFAQVPVGAADDDIGIIVCIIHRAARMRSASGTISPPSKNGSAFCTWYASSSRNTRAGGG